MKYDVVIIGAGPAGLEAAVTLTKRGFDVTVFEKSDRIGGAVNLADAPIGKYKLGWLIDYYERMIRKLGQQLRINRSKIKETSDTNTDFDDLDSAIRSGYFLKDGLSNHEDFYYLNLLITVPAAARWKTRSPANAAAGCGGWTA